MAHSLRDICFDSTLLCMFGTLRGVFGQALFGTHIVVLCEFESLSVQVFLSALLHTRLCFHEEITACSLSDVLGTEVILRQSVLQCGFDVRADGGEGGEKIVEYGE